MAEKINGRLAYADLLRVAAALAVVVLHVACSQMYRVPVDSGAWAVFNVYDSLVRWCVPVFIMISGMFLLDPKRSLPLSKLLFHNGLRIFIALIFWGLVYAVVDFLLADGRFTWGAFRAALRGVLTGHSHYHLWYLFMLLGLYLVTPILRAFVRGAKRSDFHWFFLLAFVFASLLPVVFQLWPNASESIRRWYDQLRMPVVMGFVGFYVAGYYLKEYTISRLTEAIFYLLGVGGAAVTIWGTRVLSLRQGQPVVLLYDYLSPNVVFFSVAVVVLFRYVLGVSDERSRRQHVGGLARLSFGAFLVHDLFLILLRELGVTTLSFAPVISVPLLAFLVFTASMLVAWILSKLPILNHWIM